MDEGVLSASAAWLDLLSAVSGFRNVCRGRSFHHESPVVMKEGLPGFLDRGTAAAIAASVPYQRRIDELNASLGMFLAQRTELSVWGRNLTDNRTLMKIFDSVAQPQGISGYTNQPRTYGASVRYRF